MAKKDEARDVPGDVQEQLDRIGRGEQIQGGWCLDWDRDPPVYKCGDLDERIASGEVSVSWDGTKVFNLKDGTLEERESDRGPGFGSGVGVAGFTPVSSGTPTVAGDTATTDNAPTGGGGRVTART